MVNAFMERTVRKLDYACEKSEKEADSPVRRLGRKLDYSVSGLGLKHFGIVVIYEVRWNMCMKS